MYKRLLKKQIKSKLFSGKAIIITGARQTGKTTLALEIIGEIKPKKKTRLINCDNPTDRVLLSNKNLDFLKQLVGDAEIIFIDEGQKAETIGQTLKLLVDYYKKKKQFIVTGSSSFNLLDRTEEALTGRKFVFRLFPLSAEEIFPDKNFLSFQKSLEGLLIYGSYPEVVQQKSFEDKQDLLLSITSSYLYKDILEFRAIKNPEILTSLLKALSLQIGKEVSYTEISNLIGIDKKTVESYIDILEKSYIIFRLPPYYSNRRKEISKLRKIYFYDVGIRNAVINNFNFLDARGDIGELWENYLMVERMKFQTYHKIIANNYFWRTYDGTEIDLVEDGGGKIVGYEFKWNEKKGRMRAPDKWKEYKNSGYKIVTPKTIQDFII
ncbi:MAG: ATP-binding protein [Candidatus Moranbacteria bacterium]|nr:ATP-binding protein [Candidatus Moranbacteria bacterium]